MAVTCTTSNLSELAACFSCLSPQELQAIQTYLLCQLANDGGGGGGGDTITTAEVWAASGVPAHTPTIDRQIYLNTDDGTQYNWYSSAWH